MATLTLKNIPDDLYELLKEIAAANHRSINGQIIAFLEQALRSTPIDPEEFLAQARLLRELTSDYILTDEEINRAKRAGRP